MSPKWFAELITFFPVNIPRKSESILFDNIANLTYSYESLIQTVSHTLLRLIPNVLLNKREDAIAALVTVICTNGNNQVREKLLQHLFNLKKKPNSNERAIILAGSVCFFNYP